MGSSIGMQQPVCDPHRQVRARLDLKWTSGEDRIIAALYPDFEAMTGALRHRSYSALRNRAGRLGIRKPKHVWTTKDNELLARSWHFDANELRAVFPGMRYNAIIKHGEFLKLGTRGQVPCKVTGDPMLDAIRDRCRELGYSMIYLDELADTNLYFQKGMWGCTTTRLSMSFKAINALGGTFAVAFPD